MNELKDYLFIFIIVGILALIFLVCFITIHKLNKTYKNLKKIDEGGYLYSLDYVYDYEKKIIKFPLKLFKERGCTTFSTYNKNNEFVTARNYDFPHKDKNGNETGLNIIFKLNKIGKYKSINIADACLISEAGLNYKNNSLNRKNNFMLALIPYLTMDAMNEKGLHCSILYLDTKENEKPVHQREENKKSIIIIELLRLIIDNCKDVNEAIELTKKYNMVNSLKHDYHLYISDVSGNSMIFEWRYNKFTYKNVNASTNFYLTYDDGEDFYIIRNEEKILVDKLDRLGNLKINYNYGYGHGYNRFNKVVKELDNYIIKNNDNEYSIVEDEKIVDIIKNTAQYDIGENTQSLTRYTALYNHTKLEVDIYIKRNYDKYYKFKLDEE